MPASRLRLALAAALLCAAPLAAQEPVVAGDTGRRLDSLVRAAEAEGFHGAVLVAQRGDVLLHAGYGFANEGARARFSPATLVQIGSNVKDFTRVAIYQLVEAGRLRLTDSLPRFFPRVAAGARAITLAHLLAHTTGLPLGMGGDDRPVTRELMLQMLDTLRLPPPPAAESYSNMGYALLAAVIEQVSGQPYDVYVRDRILRPAGMTETGSFLPGFDRMRIAHGYDGTRDIGIILDKPHDADGHLYSLRGNGGYLATLADMHRFYRALHGPALLREARHRTAVLPPDGPSVLAGSDLVSFFLFANFPGAEAEIFIATNHSTSRGNRLLPAIEEVLGIRRGGGGAEDGRQIVTTGGDDPRPAGRITAPLMDRLPDTGAGRTIRAYLDAFNSGDTAQVRRFFVEHAVAGPGSPPIGVRLERYRQMRENLGRLTFRGWRPSPDGVGIAVLVTSAQGAPVTLLFDLEADPPYRLRGLRVEVG